MYDFAHGQSDSIEGVTHSLCSLEYEDHRPLYDWFLNELEIFHPRQIEFGRFNLNYTVMSKRKLLTLVKEGHVHCGMTYADVIRFTPARVFARSAS
jgi:glutaminyl-tRNA synthetase